MSNKKTGAVRLPKEQAIYLAVFGDKEQRRFANRTIKAYNKRGQNKRSR